MDTINPLPFDEDTRCTAYTLQAFGIDDVSPQHGTGVCEALTDAGFKWEPILDHEATVRTFLRENPTGDFYISTAGHAMAVRDGVLFDTAEGSDLRRITAVIRVLNAHPIQECDDCYGRGGFSPQIGSGEGRIRCTTCGGTGVVHYRRHRDEEGIHFERGDRRALVYRDRDTELWFVQIESELFVYYHDEHDGGEHRTSSSAERVAREFVTGSAPARVEGDAGSDLPPGDHHALETLFEGADGSDDYALPEEDTADRIDASDLVIRPDSPEAFRVYTGEKYVGRIVEAETPVGPGWMYAPNGHGASAVKRHPHFNHCVQAAVDDVNGDYAPTAPAEPASA